MGVPPPTDPSDGGGVRTFTPNQVARVRGLLRTYIAGELGHKQVCS